LSPGRFCQSSWDYVCSLSLTVCSLLRSAFFCEAGCSVDRRIRVGCDQRSTLLKYCIRRDIHYTYAEELAEKFVVKSQKEMHHAAYQRINDQPSINTQRTSFAILENTMQVNVWFNAPDVVFEICGLICVVRHEGTIASPFQLEVTDSFVRRNRIM
jgi:hypothetical protein